ncbi:hypothetical protein HT031_000209 [Scenedesmus sp. PABB004]|nr:hypothetical protein HT031_000209 [Scenedesmus sp. PABB004]
MLLRHGAAPPPRAALCRCAHGAHRRRRTRASAAATGAGGGGGGGGGLRARQAELAADLAALLAGPGSDDDATAAAAAQIVEAGAAALLASPDWAGLQAALAAAAREAGGGRAAAAAAAAAGGAGGGSPWGFALRQPGQPRPARPPLVQQAQQAQQAQLQEQAWDWGAVRRMTVLGLGSLGAARRPARPPAPPPRLAFRLGQLSLATALRRAVLRGLDAPPGAFDPDADAWDAALLRRLGFEPLEAEPSHRVAAAASPALLYLPCCPRALVGTVLAANADQLHRLAVLGTSLRSLAETEGLLDALLDGGAGDGGGGGGGAAAALADACRGGRLVEVAAPDCAAHGVGVAVHLWRRAAGA